MPGFVVQGEGQPSRMLEGVGADLDSPVMAGLSPLAFLHAFPVGGPPLGGLAEMAGNVIRIEGTVRPEMRRRARLMAPSVSGGAMR